MLIEMTLRAGRVVQVVECLPSKCDPLSSNPCTTKKKKKKKKRKRTHTKKERHPVFIT
jgi:hypothetical protein